MKTRLFIFLGIVLPLFAFSQTKTTDFKWSGNRSFLNNFEVTYLDDQYSTFYYLMDNYIMITSNMKGVYPKKVEFENGEVKKISDSLYCIKPKKLGKYLLTIDNDFHFYLVKTLPLEKINLKFSASTSPYPECITLEELKNSNEILGMYNYNKIKIKNFGLSFTGKYPSSMISGFSYNNFSTEFKNTIEENIIVNSKIYLDHIKIYLNDTIVDLPSVELKVIDSYENEYIRRTLKSSSFSGDLEVMKNDLRIKITGTPQQEDIQTIKDLADELNGILETIQVKIVDKQPSLTIMFDTSSYKFEPPNKSSSTEVKDFYEKQHDDFLKTDSSFMSKGYQRIMDGFLLERSNLFFPFNKKYRMYYKSWSKGDRSDYGKLMIKVTLRRNIIGLLENILDSKIHYSYSDKYNAYLDISTYEKYFLKTLYSYGGEEKIKEILNEGKVKEDKTPLYVFLLVISVILLFVFSEIYQYYGISHHVGKIKNKILKRIVESMLLAQIPVVAILFVLILKFLQGDFHEISLLIYFEIFFVPFTILTGIFFLGLDYLLNKIKINWIVVVLNLFLSFFCVALAYQLIYFTVSPEMIKVSVLPWETTLIPFLITAYRLYSRFQTNKISSLLQEKELELSKQKELKFKSDLNALQARINPHFLYNALNSLASLTHIDSDRTEKMALSLSKLFRYNINKNDEHYATLKDEIEMAEIYLAVEKNRFEDKLNYTIEIEEALKEFIIPKFILQPLAENAVKHGISKITGKGMIRINIKEEAQKVIIEIYDNGPDFPGGLISGYGLQNTYEKLKLLYKKPFDISFINKPEKKLVISLNK